MGLEPHTTALFFFFAFFVIFILQKVWKCGIVDLDFYVSCTTKRMGRLCLLSIFRQGICKWQLKLEQQNSSRKQQIQEVLLLYSTSDGRKSISQNRSEMHNSTQWESMKKTLSEHEKVMTGYMLCIHTCILMLVF